MTIKQKKELNLEDVLTLLEEIAELKNKLKETTEFAMTRASWQVREIIELKDERDIATHNLKAIKKLMPVHDAEVIRTMIQWFRDDLDCNDENCQIIILEEKAIDYADQLENPVDVALQGARDYVGDTDNE